MSRPRPAREVKEIAQSPAPRRAFGYCRVSTIAQGDGQSIQVQREEIARICLANGWDLTEIVEEVGVSGAMPFLTRPAAANLWAKLRPGDVVVVLRLDRGFRSTSDALQTLELCRAREIGLVVADITRDDCTQGAVAQLTFSMLASVASFERSRLRERVGEGRSAKRSRGGHVGGSAPFGYIKHGEGKAAHLVADHDLQQFVLSLDRRGLPSRTIVNMLRHERGVSTTPNTVCNFLRAHRADA